MDPGTSIVIAIVGALATIASGLFIYLKSRGETGVAAFNAKAALDVRIDERITQQLEEAWTKIDALGQRIVENEEKEGRRTFAITRILIAIARQWPDEKGPDLDPSDIKEVEDTIPANWIRSK